MFNTFSNWRIGVLSPKCCIQCEEDKERSNEKTNGFGTPPTTSKPMEEGQGQEDEKELTNESERPWAVDRFQNFGTKKSRITKYTS